MSYTQYDTLMGTMTSTNGVMATFSGATEISYRTQDTGWTLAGFGSFGSSGDGTIPVTVSAPAGATGKLAFSATGMGAPAATTSPESCDAANIMLVFTFTGSGTADDVFDTQLGVPGTTCMFTLDAPTNVIPSGAGPSGSYFAHGSLTATLPTLSPSNTGTFSATW
jgi:hypothetical protein